MGSLMTYTRCEHCDGLGHARVRESLPKGDSRCRLCDGNGWLPTGLTLRQIDRLVVLRRTLDGDPGVPPEVASEVLEEVRAKLERLERD